METPLCYHPAMTRGQDITAGDIISELDRMVLRCRYMNVETEWAHGVEDALVQLRSVLRSQAFALSVRRHHATKETPTNAC